MCLKLSSHAVVTPLKSSANTEIAEIGAFTSSCLTMAEILEIPASRERCRLLVKPQCGTESLKKRKLLLLMNVLVKETDVTQV